MSSKAEFSSVGSMCRKARWGQACSPTRSTTPWPGDPRPWPWTQARPTPARPHLAKGVSKNDRGSVKRDLELLMAAQQRAGIPILIGTAAQAGGDENVNWTRTSSWRSPARRATRPGRRCSIPSNRRR